MAAFPGRAQCRDDQSTVRGDGQHRACRGPGDGFLFGDEAVAVTIFIGRCGDPGFGGGYGVESEAIQQRLKGALFVAVSGGQQDGLSVHIGVRLKDTGHRSGGGAVSPLEFERQGPDLKFLAN